MSVIPSLSVIKPLIFRLSSERMKRIILFILPLLCLSASEFSDEAARFTGLKVPEDRTNSPAMEEFLSSQSELERQKLHYLIMTLSEVRPITACGYFSISRGTLTSMLSAREDIIRTVKISL